MGKCCEEDQCGASFSFICSFSFLLIYDVLAMIVIVALLGK